MNTTSPRYKLKSEVGQIRRTESLGKKCWRYAHWLSLDVAIGAAVSAAWVSYSWGVSPSWWASLALASGALWVYSIDHWADALKAAQKPPEVISPRRRFYIETQWILLSLALMSTVIGIWAALHLPWSTLGFGAMLVFACGAYLWITQKRNDNHKKLPYPKEAVVTTLYGIALTAWPLSHIFDTTTTFSVLNGLLTTFFIFTLAWANVCLISVHERRADAAEGAPSLALWLGEYTTRNVGRGILKVGFFIWGVRTYFLFGNGYSADNLMASLPTDMNDVGQSFMTLLDSFFSLAMIFTMWRLYSRPEWSGLYYRYRLWADVIFLYPAWVMILEFF